MLLGSTGQQTTADGQGPPQKSKHSWEGVSLTLIRLTSSVGSQGIEKEGQQVELATILNQDKEVFHDSPERRTDTATALKASP